MYIMNFGCCDKWHPKNARVAQRWSTSLPRRGSRVRSPSRALITTKRQHPRDVTFFVVSSPVQGSKFDCLRFALVRAKPRSPGPRAPSRALFYFQRKFYDRVSAFLYAKSILLLNFKFYKQTYCNTLRFMYNEKYVYKKFSVVKR